MSFFSLGRIVQKRRLYENKVIHPFSFEMIPQQQFCPQLHRTRPRIKLKSLAWARTHREQLLFHPKVYARHAVNLHDWKIAAKANEWGGYWDNLPYEIWGWDQHHWYQQKYHLDSYEEYGGFNSFCAQLDPLSYFHFEQKTNCLTSNLVVPSKFSAYIAAENLQSALSLSRASAKFYNMTSDGVPIVIDSGASTSVTPFREDFVDHIIRLDNQKVDGITEEAVIEGVGPVEWTAFDDFGNKGVIRTICFYMPKAKIRLFSP